MGSSLQIFFQQVDEKVPPPGTLNIIRLLDGLPCRHSCSPTARVLRVREPQGILENSSKNLFLLTFPAICLVRREGVERKIIGIKGIDNPEILHEVSVPKKYKIFV